jgi:hypothetical protein
MDSRISRIISWVEAKYEGEKYGKPAHIDVASRPLEKRSGVVNQDSSEPSCA